MYKKLNSENDEMNAELENICSEFGCLHCDYYNHGSVRKIVDRFSACSNCEYTSNLRKLATHIDQIEDEINQMVEGAFAEAIFEKYCRRNPSIIDTTNNNILRWAELFGSDFEKVSKKERHAIVGMYMKQGVYKIK